MSTGVSVRNLNGTIEIRHSGFKIVYPAALYSLVRNAIDFAGSVPVESDAPSKRGRRPGRKVKAQAAPQVTEAKAEAAPKEEKPKKVKADPAAAAAPAVTESGVPKCEDLVAKALAEGVTSKEAIIRRMKDAGQRGGPIAIYLNKAVERFTLVIS